MDEKWMKNIRKKKGPKNGRKMDEKHKRKKRTEKWMKNIRKKRPKNGRKNG